MTNDCKTTEPDIVRISVVGNVDSGKSTLIGVLTSGELDNGRGTARETVFTHKHEVETGRTSYVGKQIMGYNMKTHIKNSTAVSASSMNKNKAWKSIYEKSTKLIEFNDLAGHKKYLKTTIKGLTRDATDYIFLIVNSLTGTSTMTYEHFMLATLLNIPIVIIVTKIDLAPANVLKTTKDSIKKMCRTVRPFTIKSNDDVEFVAKEFSNHNFGLCPVFYVSSVTGKHLDTLHSFLCQLNNRNTCPDTTKDVVFYIDDVFSVVGIGIVVSGFLRQGMVKVGDTLIHSHSSTPFHIKSIQLKRVNKQEANPGYSYTFAIKHQSRNLTIRPGSCLLTKNSTITPMSCFEATINILHHPTTIKQNYQCVVHSNTISQTAYMEYIGNDYLRSGDKSTVIFRFETAKEVMCEGDIFLFREGNTKGLGKVTKCNVTESYIEEKQKEINEHRKLGKDEQYVTLDEFLERKSNTNFVDVIIEKLIKRFGVNHDKSLLRNRALSYITTDRANKILIKTGKSGLKGYRMSIIKKLRSTLY